MKNSKWQLLEKKDNNAKIISSKENYYTDNFYQKNIENIFDSIYNKEHVLCVGQVQSGKTKNIENVINYGISNNYKLIIVFAGITKMLHRQTTNRLEKETRDSKQVKFIDDPKRVSEADFEKNCTVILSILKWSTQLKNMYKAIDTVNWKNEKVIIIDDECDYASLNVSFGMKNSITFQLISELYKRFYNVKLISFTGTPFANIMSSNSENLIPDRIVNLINYQKYCGISYFNKNANIYYKAIDTDKNSISSAKITQVFLVWLVSTACGLIENSNFKSEFLVNIEILNQNQERIMSHIKNSIRTLLWSSKIHEVIPRILIEFNLPQNDSKILHQKIQNIMEKLVEDNSFVILNSENDANNFVSGKNQFCVIVGGFMISRGITFENLTTEFFLNVPNNKIAIDTLLQRCRWFGNRTLNDRNKFLRIITNQSIINALKKAEEYVNIFQSGINTTNIGEIYSQISYLDKRNNDVESTNVTKKR